VFAASDPTEATTSTPDDYHIGEGRRRRRVVHRIHQLRLLESLSDQIVDKLIRRSTAETVS